MSGIAITIPGLDFSDINLGKVTFSDKDLESISINAKSGYEGMTFTPVVIYLPAGTSVAQQGVTWQISADSNSWGASVAGVASINSVSGVVTIHTIQSPKLIYLKATSIYDTRITAVSTPITISYSDAVEELTGITIQGDASIRGEIATYTVGYLPINTSLKGGTWSIQSGAAYASVNAQTGVLTIKQSANGNDVVIKFTTTNNSTTTNTPIEATKTINCTYYVPSIALTDRHLIISGVPSLNTVNRCIYLEFDYKALNVSATGHTLFTGENSGGGTSDAIRFGKLEALDNSRLNIKWGYDPTSLNDIYEVARVSVGTSTSTSSKVKILIKKTNNYVNRDGTDYTFSNSTSKGNTSIPVKFLIGQDLSSIGNVSDFVLRKFIYYADHEVADFSQAVADRDVAEIDVQFENDVPYNAGTSGSTITISEPITA